MLILRIYYALGMERTFSPSALDIDVHLLRILRVISAGGTITGAAKALGYSQPAISQHIQRAESRLGIPLTRRTGRATTLTEAGNLISERADAVVDILDELAKKLELLSQDRAGRVGLAGFPSASSTIAPELFATLRREKPGVTLSYHEAEPPEALELLQEGLADLALIFRYPEAAEDDAGMRGLRTLALFDDELVLALPREHPLAGDEVVELAALSDGTWIAGCPRCREHLMTLCASRGFEPVISYETDNLLAALSMVSKGLGVTLLPRLALSSAMPQSDIVITATTPSASRRVQLAWREGNELRSAIRFTIETLRRIGSEITTR